MSEEGRDAGEGKMVSVLGKGGREEGGVLRGPWRLKVRLVTAM